jgi:hypothetical protein
VLASKIGVENLSDRVIWFCCFALLSVGVIVGINLDSGLDTLDAWSKIFGIVSSIGTLLGVIFAARAIHEWRHEFSHSKKFDSFRELEDIALNCTSLLYKYSAVRLDEHRDNSRIQYYDGNYMQYSEKIDEYIRAYQKEVRYSESLLSKCERKLFIYDYPEFQAVIRAIVVNIDKAFDDEDADLVDSLNNVEHQTQDLFNDIKKNLRRFRGR